MRGRILEIAHGGRITVLAIGDVDVVVNGNHSRRS